MNAKNSKSSSQLKSSKELLYADYTGTTVVEHVLKSLEQASNLTRSEQINKFLMTKGEKSVAFERAKNLISLMEGNQNGSCLEASLDDEKAIEVQVTVGDASSDSDAEDYKADAWFVLPQSKIQESEYSDDECDKTSISSKNRNLLAVSDDSSDFSDDQYWDNFSVSAKKENLIIEEVCSEAEDEYKQNFSTCIEKKKLSNMTEDEFSHNSEYESSDSSADQCMEKFSFSTEKEQLLNCEDESLKIFDDKYEQNISISDQKNVNIVEHESSIFNEHKEISVSTKRVRMQSDISHEKFSDLSNDGCPQMFSLPTERGKNLIRVSKDESSDFSDDECPQSFSFPSKKRNLTSIVENEFSDSAFELPLKKCKRQQ